MFPKGITHVETLVAVVEDPQSSLPDSARAILKLLVDTFTALEAQITTLDVEIKQRSKSDPTARRLMTIPGVGPIHQVPAQSVDALGALTHQQIPGSEHDAIRLLLLVLTGTKRMLGRWAASQIASASAASFFCRLMNGLT